MMRTLISRLRLSSYRLFLGVVGCHIPRNCVGANVQSTELMLIVAFFFFRGTVGCCVF